MGRTTEAVVDYDDYLDLERSRDAWRKTAIFLMGTVGGFIATLIIMTVVI